MFLCTVLLLYADIQLPSRQLEKAKVKFNNILDQYRFNVLVVKKSKMMTFSHKQPVRTKLSYINIYSLVRELLFVRI